MGQCGCGDFQGDFRFPGPGNITYVVSVYPSCDYCQTPAGVVIYAITLADCKVWAIDHLPELPMCDAGTLVGVVDPRIYIKKLTKYAGVDLEGCEPDTDFAFREAVNDQIENNMKNLVEKAE